ncbi:hypothetical protein [Coleofasciculus chthonoplastes]|uniref:hypothetical protein n=1 Tax=Coleofasciculus chthonoplastes TaxID=64178 RepID=UPI0032F7645D
MTEDGEAGEAGEDFGVSAQSNAGEAGGDVRANFIINGKVLTLMSLNVISVTNLSLLYLTLSNKSVKSVF